MTLYKLKTLIIVLISLLVINSCNNEDFCLSNQHAVQVGFYNANTSTSKKDYDTTLTNISIIGLGMTDSLYGDTTLKKAFLPLRFDKDPDTTVFVIKKLDKSDTIWFIHRKELDFISGDCGYVFKFDLDKLLYTEHLIDTALIAYPIVKYGEDFENVKIYIY